MIFWQIILRVFHLKNKELKYLINIVISQANYSFIHILLVMNFIRQCAAESHIDFENVRAI